MKRRRRKASSIFNRRNLLIIVVILVLGGLGYKFLHIQENNPVHYVTTATLKGNKFIQDGWYYDGRNWAYVKNGHKVTGTRVINGVSYTFKSDGIQKLPYKVNYDYELSPTQGASQLANNKYIILHDVGSESNGKETASYMKRAINSTQSYTNFIVGDGGIVYQIKRPGIVAWGAGTEANNNSPVQIELAHAQSHSTFRADYKTYILLARDMAGKYNIPLTLDKGKKDTRGIKSHLWVTTNIWGDHQDPYEYLTKYGISKSQLANNLRNFP